MNQINNDLVWVMIGEVVKDIQLWIRGSSRIPFKNFIRSLSPLQTGHLSHKQANENIRHTHTKKKKTIQKTLLGANSLESTFQIYCRIFCQPQGWSWTTSRSSPSSPPVGLNFCWNSLIFLDNLLLELDLTQSWVDHHGQLGSHGQF